MTSPIVVSGASGFIGSHLVERLLREGQRVLLLSHTPANADKLQRQYADQAPDAVKVVLCDLSDKTQLLERLTPHKPRHVFHLAGYAHPERSTRHAGKLISANLMATVNLLRALEHSPLESFITTGSGEEYGGSDIPFKETSALRPASPYSASKAAASLWCQMAHNMLGQPTVVLRPSVVYGPRQDTRQFIPQTIAAAINEEDFAMTPGEQTRDFVYIDDVVEACLSASTQAAAAGQAFNVCSGHEVRIIEVARRIFALSQTRARILPGRLPYRDNEVWRYVGSPDKAREILGWEPRVELEDGLQRTLSWYRQQNR